MSLLQLSGGICEYETFMVAIRKIEEQDKSSEIEQQPPFGDRK